jgi:5-oxopent-3-ene-1,2,5-tricarboxylate decarboxylase/2-hydroxyhepta-2,4-diene-1,7-dioate isomerase
MPSGTVYGALLNFKHEYDLWATRMQEPPYKGAPQAPVLYIKTANTFNPSGGVITLPDNVPDVTVGASVGLVMGGEGVVGCVLMNDISIPHESYYRPPVKYKNLDGFLGVGPRCEPLATLGGLAALAALELTVKVNGELRQTVQLNTLLRPAAKLLADVHEFMTLQAGDILMLGTDCLSDGTRVLVRAGDVVEISAPGFEPVTHKLVKEST